jgi:hypothetical protein
VSRLWISADRLLDHLPSLSVRLLLPATVTVPHCQVSVHPNPLKAHNDASLPSDNRPLPLNKQWAPPRLGWLEHQLQLEDHHFLLGPCLCRPAQLILNWNFRNQQHNGRGLEAQCTPPMSSMRSVRPVLQSLDQRSLRGPLLPLRD